MDLGTMTYNPDVKGFKGTLEAAQTNFLKELAEAITSYRTCTLENQSKVVHNIQMAVHRCLEMSELMGRVMCD